MMTGLRSTMPETPLPDAVLGAARRRQGEAAVGRPRLTMAAPSGCSLLRSRLAARRSSSFSSMPSAATIAVTAGLPSVSVPVLSMTMRVDLLQPLQRLGVLDQEAERGALADADHDRHRRREAEGAGTGDDQHRDRGDEAVGVGGLRVRTAPRRRTRRWR